MSKDIVLLIHFRPIELYPPIQNIMEVLKTQSIPNLVITTHPKYNISFKFNFTNTIRINVNSNIRLIRFLKYFKFYILTFFYLVKYRPKKVLYFESISALPCILYKLIVYNSKLFVHYHEYTTQQEYRNGMSLEYFNYKLENLFKNKYYWFSHTNEIRLNLFSSDFDNLPKEKLYVMPNYPLESWYSTNKKNEYLNTSKIELVYIGAISFADTYIKEILDFVHMNQDKYNIDLYSFNLSNDVLTYIQSLKCNSIKYSGSVNYNEIPSILINKDVGLILYKASTLNYIYNAPNKLFEYLSLGLDVWFSSEMKGCYSYKTNISPKVIAVDFQNIPKSITNYKKENNLCSYKHDIYTTQIATKQLICKLIDS